jgi:uncharacterized protein
MNPLAPLIRDGDLRGLRAALDRDPALARSPQPILQAAGQARLDVLKLLVKHGADVNRTRRGYRPLHALIQERIHGEQGDPSPARLACLSWLLDHGADPDQLGAWPPARALIVAAFTGIMPFVRCLRDHGVRVGPFDACALAEVGAVKRELARNPSFAGGRDAGGLTSLQCCAGSRLGGADARIRRRQLEVAALLLDAGADPNAMTKSWSHMVDVAYFAIGARHTEMLALLLDRGADATRALSSAVWTDADRLGGIVLDRGGDANRATSGDRPLLNDLIRWGQVGAALWLLARGADPNRVDTRGWTAVHEAASRGNEKMFRAAVGAGGDERRKDAAGHTPIDVARVRGRTRLLAGTGRSAS